MPGLQRTFVMIKPDAFARGLSGEIIARFERRGFTLRGVRLLRVTEELAGQHYEEHVGKPFYPELVEFITSGPVDRDGDRGPGRRVHGAHDDGRDQSAGLARRGRSAATSRWRSARTSSTAPTRPSRPSARSRSTSRQTSWSEWFAELLARAAAGAGVAVAAAAGDPRAAGPQLHRGRSGLRRGRSAGHAAGRAGARARPRQGALGARRPGAGRGHGRRPGRPFAGQAGRRGARRGRCCARWPGAPTWCTPASA